MLTKFIPTSLIKDKRLTPQIGHVNNYIFPFTSMAQSVNVERSVMKVDSAIDKDSWVSVLPK